MGRRLTPEEQDAIVETIGWLAFFCVVAAIVWSAQR